MDSGARIRAVGVAAGFFFLGAVGSGGCGGLKWPSCDGDEACNTDGHAGVCVDGKCVACRDDKGCGEGRVCRFGRCEDVPGWCDESRPCGAGKGCKEHRCVAEESKLAPTACDDTQPCPAGTRCQNGHCVAPPKGGPGCEDFPPPKFAFESAELAAESKSTLDRLAKCLASGGLKTARVLLVGHCDARGEYEFNMSLGAERAEVVRAYLLAKGVSADRVDTTSRGRLDATGTDEAGYAEDRRVDIEVR
jgi:peptidoglycan-associated lipoprotein